MIVTVRDPKILSSLDPKQLETYLQRQGWHRESQSGEKESVWFKKTESGDEFDITLPLNPKTRSFVLRMSEAVDTLERSGRRSQLDILSELVTAVPNIKIQGMAIEVSDTGRMTMMGVVVSKLRKVIVNLSSSDFALAVKAYREQVPVVATGDLVKEGDLFWLKNPRKLALDLE